MFKQILVPLDGSAYAERALSYAADLARISDGRVTLLSVIQTVASPFTAAPEPEGALRASWLAYLEEQADALRRAGVSGVTTDLRIGEPSAIITDVARETQADLIVMSTQGLGADGRYALGSMALKVLMTAPCPLFMVRINKPAPPQTRSEEVWQDEGGANVG